MKRVAINSAAEWHQMRSRHVGGSEVAALFDSSPYLTRFQLWHVKRGSLAPEDLSGNERVAAGNYMEPAIAAWASEKWGVPLRKFQGYAKHERVAGMGCTPDYITESGDLLVQIKNVDGLQFRREWEAEGDTIATAPLHILLQVQHELAVTGIPAAWLVACVGGNRLCRMEIAPRPITIAKLEAEVAAFWQSVESGKEPKIDFEKDAATIAAIHSAASDPVAAIDLSSNNRAHEICANYIAAAEAEKSATAAKDAAKAELLTLIGDAGKATVGDFTIAATNVAATKGKPITPEMVGMLIGVRKGYRRFSISQPQGDAE